MDQQLHYQIMYALEHRFLPDMLFGEDRIATFAALLTGKGSFLRDMLDAIGKGQGYVCPYAPEDFQILPQLFRAEDGRPTMGVLEIVFPEPPMAPLCERVFICHDERMEKLRYYTVEKSIFRPMLCRWDEDGQHSNYGDAPADAEAQLGRVLELYAEEIGGEG